VPVRVSASDAWWLVAQGLALALAHVVDNAAAGESSSHDLKSPPPDHKKLRHFLSPPQ